MKGVLECLYVHLLDFFNVGTIQIEQKGQGIALYAPGHGLQEVYYASDQWMVSQKMKRLPNNGKVQLLGYKKVNSFTFSFDVTNTVLKMLKLLCASLRI